MILRTVRLLGRVSVHVMCDNTVVCGGSGRFHQRWIVVPDKANCVKCLRNLSRPKYTPARWDGA
jgi:hypothetical protein